MSTRAVIEVACDGPDAATPCPESSGWSDYGTAAQLRARMREGGWQTGQRGGVDRCPSCRRTA